MFELAMSILESFKSLAMVRVNCGSVRRSEARGGVVHAFQTYQWWKSVLESC